MTDPTGWSSILILVSFNLPIIIAAICLAVFGQLTTALQEKAPDGTATGTTSSSRVTSLLGAVAVTSFFWAIGNLILLKAMQQVTDIKPITDNVGRFFLIGSALFLPYAFNQLSSVFGPSPTAPQQPPAPPQQQQPPPPPPPPPPAPPQP